MEEERTILKPRIWKLTSLFTFWAPHSWAEEIEISPVETALILVAALVAGVAFWCGVVYLIGSFSGWKTLARKYTATGSPSLTGRPLRRYSFQSGRLGRWATYRGSLTLAADPRGLVVDVLAVFRPGHPKLRIPWNHLTVYEARSLVAFYREVRLECREVPEVPIFLNREAVEVLFQESGAGIPILPAE